MPKHFFGSPLCWGRKKTDRAVPLNSKRNLNRIGACGQLRDSREAGPRGRSGMPLQDICSATGGIFAVMFSLEIKRAMVPGGTETEELVSVWPWKSQKSEIRKMEELLVVGNRQAGRYCARPLPMISRGGKIFPGCISSGRCGFRGGTKRE